MSWRRRESFRFSSSATENGRGGNQRCFGMWSVLKRSATARRRDMNTDNSKHLARALLDVCSGSIDEIGPQEAVAALYSCMSFVVAQAPKEHDATIRESLKSAVQEIADLAAEAREIYAAAPMTSQQIGDVACDVTKKLEEPFAVALCFHEWAPASNDSDFVGIVAFNHPRDWSPTADERVEVDDCCGCRAANLRGQTTGRSGLRALGRANDARDQGNHAPDYANSEDAGRVVPGKIFRSAYICLRNSRCQRDNAMSDARTERIDAAVGAGGELVGCLLQEGPVTPGQARLIVEAVVRAAVLNAEDWEVRESAARIATELERS